MQPPPCYNLNMSIFTSVSILFLAMLIQAFLQLTPGLFSIFYHSALAKTTRKKADDLALYYILGVEVSLAIIFIAIFFLMALIFTNQSFITGIFPWLMAGIFGAESVAVFFYYFRKKSTALFLPRKAANSLALRAKNLKNRSDAFVLGFIAALPELIFTIPLFMIVSFEMLKISDFPSYFIVFLYILFAISPLFLIRTFFRGDLNLADIQKLRTKNQPFYRLILTIGFLLLALLMINSGLI